MQMAQRASCPPTCFSRRALKMSRLSFADAHRDDGKRFIVRADEKLTAFLELETATRACGGFCVDNLAKFLSAFCVDRKI